MFLKDLFAIAINFQINDCLDALFVVSTSVYGSHYCRHQHNGYGSVVDTGHQRTPATRCQRHGNKRRWTRARTVRLRGPRVTMHVCMRDGLCLKADIALDSQCKMPLLV